LKIIRKSSLKAEKPGNRREKYILAEKSNMNDNAQG
jgi:hypothetical protein